jgi:hypothetical protein
MAKIQFLGRVLPEFARVSMPPRSVEWTEDDTKAKSRMRLRIHESIINVECESDIYSRDNLHPLYIRAIDLARASINVVAFARGEGLSLILDLVIYDDGVPLPMSPHTPTVAGLCTAYQVNEPDTSTLEKIYDMVLNDPGLSDALNDLMLAITVPRVAAMVCGRAMDGLKNLLSPPGTKAPQAWAQMQQILRIERNYRQFITTASARPRHAHRDHIPGDVTRKIWRRSWIIMDRYLEYRKRGSQPLPASEFCLLTDDE